MGYYYNLGNTKQIFQISWTEKNVITTRKALEVINMYKFIDWMKFIKLYGSRLAAGYNFSFIENF